jgi:hypothetical protein
VGERGLQGCNPEGIVARINADHHHCDFAQETMQEVIDRLNGATATGPPWILVNCVARCS